MSTNFNQILDEIQQQKLQVAALIDDNNAKVLQSQQSIQQAEQELTALTDQLAGLALLEQRTQELQDDTSDDEASPHDINLNINVTAAQPTVFAETDAQRVIISNSTSVPGQPTETSPVFGTTRVKTVRHG